jgi:hypothetical protein
MNQAQGPVVYSHDGEGQVLLARSLLRERKGRRKSRAPRLKRGALASSPNGGEFLGLNHGVTVVAALVPAATLGLVTSLAVTVKLPGAVWKRT